MMIDSIWEIRVTAEEWMICQHINKWTAINSESFPTIDALSIDLFVYIWIVHQVSIHILLDNLHLDVW